LELLPISTPPERLSNARFPFPKSHFSSPFPWVITSPSVEVDPAASYIMMSLVEIDRVATGQPQLVLSKNQNSGKIPHGRPITLLSAQICIQHQSQTCTR